ncbi:unnamed protein product [Dovyalis caffra]|uniref:Uncharacterized protein n=1 Tax=Dovyalis caffra TaxID=77055 RepID=A0AAV1SGD4_9ROSI|nr:unnamed protein product [Dovyalis caffra]
MADRQSNDKERTDKKTKNRTAKGNETNKSHLENIEGPSIPTPLPFYNLIEKEFQVLEALDAYKVQQ